MNYDLTTRFTSTLQSIGDFDTNEYSERCKAETKSNKAKSQLKKYLGNNCTLKTLSLNSFLAPAWSRSFTTAARPRDIACISADSPSWVTQIQHMRENENMSKIFLSSALLKQHNYRCKKKLKERHLSVQKLYLFSPHS